MTRFGWTGRLAIPLLCRVVAADDKAIAPPGAWQHPPALGRPKGQVVRVRTVDQLQTAVKRLRSNTTIMIEPGNYPLEQSLQISGVQNVALRGAGEDRTQVVIRGPGMRKKAFGDVPHGIMVNDASEVLIANLSVGDVWFHPITLQGQLGCEKVRIFNVRLFDAGEQFIKANPDGKGGGPDDCLVEYCLFEFTDTARHNYTQGMSVHACSNWIVRNNLFRNIRGPKDDPSVGGCIDFWNGSKNTLVEGNVIANCRMGIRFGIVNRQEQKGFHDHQGGIIRNNFIWREPGAVTNPDGGIMIWDSPGTKVLHNTVILNDTYENGAIEYRWSTGVVIANNLTDARIWKREAAEAQEDNNTLLPARELFVDAGAGDWSFSPTIAARLRRVAMLPDCTTDRNGQKRASSAFVGADEIAAGTR